LKFLHRRGHNVLLATVYENDAERQSLDYLASSGIRVVTEPHSKAEIMVNLVSALLTGKPLQARYSWNRRLWQQLKHILTIEMGSWDIIHIEHLRGAQYGISIQTECPHINSVPPIIWDSVDNITLLFEQAAHTSRSAFGKWVTRFELPRTRRFERDIAGRFNRLLVTSPVDRQAFERLGVDPTKITILTNGVDLNYFSPINFARQPKQIVFSGKLSYHANITAALYLVQEIMPQVWSSIPEVEVTLVGKDPPGELLHIAQNEPRVKVTGYVPDIRPYLRQASVAVAPLLYGAGIQNKVLEAMACGTPVVANPQAVSAIPAIRGQDVLVEDTTSGLAQAIIKLLNDPALSAEIGRKGRQYVTTFHDWNSIAANLEAIYLGANQQTKQPATV
jgi:glycosyltransferase involved in cell wall biosynthesis